jgi:zinc transporter 1/2/3
MNADFFKFVSAVIVFILNVCCSLLPLSFTSRGWISKAESLAGGVFLGSAIVHLIPEAIHSFEGLSESPLAPIVILICFTVLLSVEVFAQSHVDETDHSDRLLHSRDSPPSHKPEIKGTPFPSWAPGKLSSVVVVLYGVLIFHGFVEAIAFGIMKEQSVLLALFCAIIGHKPVETFALGLELLKNRPTQCTYFAMMFVFSSVAPATILVTIWIEKHASPLFFGIVTSASAGAFLFVGCHELSELLHHAGKWPMQTKITHLLFFVAGAAWMAVFGLMGGEHHHE